MVFSARARSRLRLSTCVLSMVALLWVAAAALLERVGDRPDPEGSFDAIVVLGCRVLPSGKPSAALRRRTLHAVRLYRRGTAPTLVFTGGVGEHGGSEARAAAEVALAHGVPSSAIVLEEGATSTYESAELVAELIGPGRVLVVTDAYHVLRSERVFARRFSTVDAVGSIGSSNVRVYGGLREVVAVAAYGVLGRLY